MWQSWISFILGLIIFFVAILTKDLMSVKWILWLGGLLIAIFGLWGGLSKPKSAV